MNGNADKKSEAVLLAALVAFDILIFFLFILLFPGWFL